MNEETEYDRELRARGFYPHEKREEREKYRESRRRGLYHHEAIREAERKTWWERNFG